MKIDYEQIIQHAKQKLPKRTQVTSFVIVSLCLVSVLQGLIYVKKARQAKGEILGVATSAYADLNSAQQNLTNMNFAQSLDLFVSAENNISIAQEKLDKFKPLEWLAPQAASANHLLDGASKLAQAGQKLSQALSLFDELKVSSKGVETTDFDQKLVTNWQLLSESKDLVSEASDEFDLVSSIPSDYSETLNTAKVQVKQLELILEKLTGLEELYIKLFDGNKTYLLIFQNYDEVRATGGFIGTYGVLKTNNGSIDKLKIESIYNLDGQISERIAAPGPFQPEIKKWGIRDANWFADFPTSAKKLLYFFELGSQTADGVLALTPSTFQDLLKLTGPIEMPDYDVTLTSENFQEIVQFQTSVDYDKVLNQPKKFLADFAPVLLDRLSGLSRDQWFSVFQIFENSLEQKQIMVYSNQPEVQSRVEDLGFSGKLLSTDYDYLNIINTNLGGTKSDLSIKQTGQLESKILSDGSVINSLAISRDNLGVVNNKDYLRVFVPLGSTLVSSTGFDEYDYSNSQASGFQTDPDLRTWDQGTMANNVYTRVETGKTEFAGWVNTDAQHERSITITYVLPFKITTDQGYSLLLQKQAGSLPYRFSATLSLGNFGIKWLGQGISLSGNSINFSSETNTDDFWPIVIAK